MALMMLLEVQTTLVGNVYSCSEKIKMSIYKNVCDSKKKKKILNFILNMDVS